jgi:phage-related tail protein
MGFLSSFGNFFSGIGKGIKHAVSPVTGFLGNIVHSGTGLIGTVVNDGTGLVGNTIGGAFGTINNAVGAVGNLGGKALNTVGGLGSDITSSLMLPLILIGGAVLAYVVLNSGAKNNGQNTYWSPSPEQIKAMSNIAMAAPA